jgi:arsenate reductase
MQIYHNPRCAKSRESLALLKEHDIDPEIVLYLENPPSKSELIGLLRKLNIPAEKLIRKGEKIFKEHFKGKALSEEEWIEAMLEHPKLIERPIIVKGENAVIGRPPSTLLSLL